MNLFILLTAILLSFIVVRIGAMAFHLTGVKWDQAKFQSLSCFNGAGFTTRESELILKNTQRRRIAGYLMILGNVGIVTMIATFANSIRPGIDFTLFNIPFFHEIIPSAFVPFINLLIIIIAVVLFFRFFTNSKVSKKFTEIIRKKLTEKDRIEIPSYEEFFLAASGYGVTQIDIGDDSIVLNKT
ncbi:hypothetical protein ACFL6I_12545 [candidate division KSB1 bacterium]